MRLIDAADGQRLPNALAILKIQLHRDCSKELADNRRFTLAANIEIYFCDPNPVAARVEI
jgi:hypothetical protein